MTEIYTKLIQIMFALVARKSDNFTAEILIIFMTLKSVVK